MSARKHLRRLVRSMVIALVLIRPGLAEAADVIAFSESFESALTAQWTQDSQNDWFVSTQRASAGSRSAEVDGLATDAALTSIPINLPGGTQATVKFRWYIESGLDAGEYLAFDVSANGGSTWTERARLRGNVDPENTWRSVQLDLTGLAFLRLRFRGSMSATDEDANIDDLLVTLPVASTNSAPVITLPANRSNPVGSVISSFGIAVTDADNDPVTCVISGLPSGLQEKSECAIGGTITANPGTYTVTVTANDGKTSSSPASFNWTVTSGVATANPETPPAPAAAPSMTPDAASSRVGATSGAFDVDATGSATYSIPIQTAPGSGGMAPKVSLGYSSQAGNGPLGVGWSIDGLSSITRCSRSIEQDGAPGRRGVSLTANDRFCLDGQRLMVIAGTYGQAGAEYRTEIDSISKIIASGQAGNGPQSFTVWRKDGSVALYGGTSDSRIEARSVSDSQTVLTWAMNRVTDKAGNYINFVYNEFGGANGEPVEALLANIYYTGNTRAATSPYAQIDFIYDTNRADTTVTAMAGARQIQSRLLKRIDSRSKVTASGSLMNLRSYHLAYLPGMDGHGRSALNSVTECSDASKTYCFPPTVFNWQRSKHQVSTNSSSLSNSVFSAQHAALTMADFNGDSRPDLLLTERFGSQEYRFRTALALASGGFASASTNTYTIPNNGLASAPVTLRVIDLNADGMQDVIYPTSGGWKGRLANASGFGAEITVASGCCGLTNPPLVRVMDFDGDGLSDLITTRATTGAGSELVLLRNRYSPANPGSASLGAPAVLSIDTSALSLFPERSGNWFIDDEAPHFENATSTNAAFARPLDFNGDGSVDLLVRLSQRYVQCGNGCSANLESPAAQPGVLNRFTFEAAGTSAGESVQAGEIYASASFYLLLLSDGGTAFSAPQVVATADDCMVYDACNPFAGLPRVRRLLPVDINGDGLGDLVRQDMSFDWYANLNLGNGFDPAAIAIASFDGSAPWQYAASQFVDMTGDGLPELIYPNLSDNANAVWQLHENLQGRAFTAVQTSTARYGKSGEHDQSVFVDINGDGMLDNLFVDLNTLGEVQSGTTRVFLGQNSLSGASPGNAMNLVSGITDGMGNTTTINYKPLTDATVYARMNDGKSAVWGAGSVVIDLVVPIYVVSQVERSAPQYNNPGAKSRLEYRYVGARLQAGGRGFLGFGEMISYNPQLGVRTNQRFRQDFPFIGLPADTAEFRVSSSQKLDALSNTSASSPVAWATVSATTSPPSASGTLLSYSVNQWSAIETVSGKKTWIPLAASTLERSYTIGSALNRKVHTSNTFSSYGDLTSSVVNTYATDTGSAFSTQTSTHTYLAPDTANWRIGRLNLSSVVHARSGQTSVTRQSGYGYDATTGILNQEVVEPNTTAFKVVTNYQLDSFGHHISATVTGNGMAARVSTFVYEPLGRLVVEERNAYNQVARKILTWDAWGNPLVAENIDSVRTTTAVDLMGRPFVSYTATGAWSKTLHSTATTSYCPSADTAFHTITSGGGLPLRYQCYDRLGREVRTATQGFDGGMIFVDRFFDAMGRPERVSEPYFSGSTSYWNLTAYDALGRVDSVLAADGNDLTFDYDQLAVMCGISGAVRQVETINGLGQSRLELRNPLGEVTAIYDAACGKVGYEYNAAGNPVRVTGADGVITTTTYDQAGRKTKLVDPDKGTWQYVYNPLGELTRQLDSKNQAIDFSYDLLGRVIDRQEISGTSSLTPGNGTVRNREVTTWNNSTSGSVKGKSQVASVTYRAGLSGAISHQRIHSYDGFGRPGGTSTSMDGMTLAEETTYDQFGRIFQQFDASGDDRGLRYHYNARGYTEKLQEAREGTNGLVYQQVQGMDARGNITYMLLGNGIEAFATYSGSSGRIEELEAYDAQDRELQLIRYGFDVAGNLLYRHDTSGSNNLRESHGYDLLNRLENTLLSVNGGSAQTTLSLRYNKSGNIDFKSDVGNYQYGQSTSRPHAATTAGSATYSYDANGNQVSSSTGRTITYTLFDQAARIQRGSEYTEFSYGIGNERIKRMDNNAVDQSRTTRYFGNVERIEQDGGKAFFRRSVGGIALVEYYPSTGSQAVSWVLRDHLGSIDKVVSSSGVSAMSFSAFGERRAVNWQGQLGASLSRLANMTISTRGFTGHEHVDGLGVIHMNGRIYDPKLGRFLQADPFVQDPGNSQSLNRFSYVLNNPLSFTDPSGYFSFDKFVGKWGRLIVAAVVSYFTYGAASGWAAGWLAGTALAGNSLAIGAIAGGIAGFVGGAIVSGTLKGAFQGVAAGALMGGVAGYYGNTYSINRVAADSLAGGVSAEIYGQDFKNGLIFGALISSATYAGVRLRAYQKAQSGKFPGQIGESEGFRAIDGKIAGERTYEKLWIESGAAQSYADGYPLQWVIDNKYLPYKGKVSPLGGFQGSSGLVFGAPYGSGGLIDYILEGYSGVHDTLNQPYFYTANGTNRSISGFWQKSLGYLINPANVLLASPIVLPALVPDYMRYLYFQERDQ